MQSQIVTCRKLIKLIFATQVDTFTETMAVGTKNMRLTRFESYDFRWMMSWSEKAFQVSLNRSP